MTKKEKLMLKKTEALIKLQIICKTYRDRGFIKELVDPILDQKTEFILEAETVQQIAEILKPSEVIYNGKGFVPKTAYHMEEEELIQWSLASWRYVSDSNVVQRMEELMTKILGTEFMQKSGII